MVTSATHRGAAKADVPAKMVPSREDYGCNASGRP
ncbi:hypothetical protein ACVI1J_007155 [Bradyrhizobium diazoefficiens]